MRWPKIILIGLVGCNDEDRPCLLIDCESEETSETSEQPEIQRVAWDCCNASTTTSCSDPGESWYDIAVDGLVETSWLDIVLTDGNGQAIYQESHEAPLLLSDAGANWSTFFLELEQVTDPDCETLAECPEDRYDSGVLTLYSCLDLDPNQVNWTVILPTEETDESPHCVTWGATLDTSSDCSPIQPDA